MKKLSLKHVNVGYEFDDNPLKSIVYIYGDEGLSTTTLALSVVDTIPDDKRVYIMSTEPPHNETGIIKKHFMEQYNKGKFVLPIDKKTGDVMTLTEKSGMISFLEKTFAADDCGVLVIDALDSVRAALFMDGAMKFGMKAWSNADDFIVENIILKVLEKGIPMVAVMKEKEDIIVNADSSITKLGKIVPMVKGTRIQRWASTRLRCIKIGEFEVMKSKGNLNKAERKKFKWSKKTGNTGFWMSSIYDAMRVV